MKLEGKTIVITGAARGLGAAMAKGLAARGANLALADLDLDALEPTRHACAEHGVAARAYAANVADEQDVARLYERVVEDFEGLDASVANAGILRDGLLIKAREGKPIEKLSLENWQAVIDVNLTGVFLCGREAAAHMARIGAGGAIVNISSISRDGNFGQSNYSASKAGVAALTVVWAKELARHSIRVNAIAPGFIETEMVASMRQEILEKMAAGIPVGRLGQPEEIAHTLVYLLENDYFNGRIIEVDGGQRI
ncbi:MAG: SDR family oxidoreductase [Gammaproteobacteria bacterium]|nr:SDR family oxidoreductase [Gammaproteobacteria bacterium]